VAVFTSTQLYKDYRRIRGVAFFSGDAAALRRFLSDNIDELPMWAQREIDREIRMFAPEPVPDAGSKLYSLMAEIQKDEEGNETIVGYKTISQTIRPGTGSETIYGNINRSISEFQKKYKRAGVQMRVIDYLWREKTPNQF